MSRLGAAVGLLVEKMNGINRILGMQSGGVETVKSVSTREKKTPEEKRASELSHALSKFMRHTCDAKLYGADGRMRIEDLLKGIPKPKGKDAAAYTAEEVRALVRAEEGSSKRHGIDTTGEYVYCYQGLKSSYFTPVGPIDRDKLYGTHLTSPLSEPVFHSTSDVSVAGIDREGLNPSDRDIHMWTKDGEKKGRADFTTIYKIDMGGAMAHGCVFWKAGNGVVLTDKNIPFQFLKKQVIDEDIDWDDEFFAKPWVAIAS